MSIFCIPCPHGGTHGSDYCSHCEQNTGEYEGESYCAYPDAHDEEERMTMGYHDESSFVDDDDKDSNSGAESYIQPEDLAANLRDQQLGPRARKIARGVLQQLEKLRVAIEQDNRFGSEPQVGSVVSTTKTFRGAGLHTYVWLRSDAGWHVTGRGSRVWTFDEIVDFAGDDEIRVSHVEDWTTL